LYNSAGIVNTIKHIARTPINTPTAETIDIKTEAANSINAIATQALRNPKNIFFMMILL
jgi:hypothetical protein